MPNIKFYCILNLHYSQTSVIATAQRSLFYCILNLHYSQTPSADNASDNMFYCILNLHYSQTLLKVLVYTPLVLLYSEFTLLSNLKSAFVVLQYYLCRKFKTLIYYLIIAHLSTSITTIFSPSIFSNTSNLSINKILNL